jgi:hypothetical protein
LQSNEQIHDLRLDGTVKSRKRFVENQQLWLER